LCDPGPVTDPRTHPAPVQWLVVGIGDITSKRVIPAILAEPRSRLAGLVSRNPAKAVSYNVPVFTSFEEAVANPAFDAVYVATPVALHHPQTIAALRAGKHVLCEKPVGLNHNQAVQMAGAAREAGRLLGVAYYRRNFPKVLRARQLLAEGVIGQPVQAYLSCHSWFTDADGTRSWLLDPAMAGGGPLYDIASHRIDILNFLFGQPRRACGQTSNVVHGTAVEDAATVLVEYSGGLRGIVDVRWHSEVARDEFRIVGTRGEMDLSPLSSPPLVWPGGSEQIPTHANVHYPLIENFVDAVLGVAPLASTGESAQWTDWVTEQVLAGEGKR